MFRSYRDTVITSIKVNTETLKQYFCDLCPVDSDRRVWSSESDVEIHRRKVHKAQLIELLKDSKNLMCTICLRPQADKAALIAHIKTNHLLTPERSTIVKHEIFICNYCQNIFFNKLLLITHIQYYHLRSMWKKKKNKVTVVCPYCDRCVAAKSVWFHYINHSILRPSTCPICVSPFDDKKEVLKHVESHKCNFSCCLCSYETKKSNLFTNHIEEKHKKRVSLEGRKDVAKVIKYYVPQKRIPAWNRKVLNVFRGIPLATEVQICVLCRTMCESDLEMLQHIYGDHSPDSVNEIKRHLCQCGEEFFNGVLLKHHVFKLKGDHKVYDGTGLPTLNQVPEVNSDIHEEITTQNDESQITQVNDDVDRTFGIVIEIRESGESDNDQKPITIGSHSDTEDESDFKIQIDDEMQSQFQDDTDAQSQNENELEFKSHEMDVESTELNREMDISKQDLVNIQTQIDDENEMIIIQDQNEEEAQIQSDDETDIQKPNKFETVVQIQNDDIIIAQNQNEFINQVQNENETLNKTIQFHNDTYNKNDTDARELIISGKRKAETFNNNAKHFAIAAKDTTNVFNNIEKTFNQHKTIIVNEETANSNNPVKDIIENVDTKTDIQNINKNKIIFINNIIQNFEIEDSDNIQNDESNSSKKYYEEIENDMIEDSCDSTESLQQNLDCTYESDREMTVYEVIEVPADSSEESGKIIIEDSFI